VPDDPKGAWSHQKFVTRARTVLFARIGFLTIGLGILLVPRWAYAFGAVGSLTIFWYILMIVASVASYLIIERGWAGKAATFASLCLELLVLMYMIAYSGGLKSPVLPTQLIYTMFFALLFPNPLAIVPPLLTLPIIAKIDTELPTRILQLEDIFLLIWYSAANFIVVYVIVYLNGREDKQHNEIIGLQENLQHLAVVEERNRLAREIHDGLGASLSSLIIQSEYLQRISKDEALKDEIRELKEVAEESIDELRRSISMMRDDFDLAPLLEDYCCTWSQRTGLSVEVQAKGVLPRLDGAVHLATFRVLQEALTNVRKHAQASKVLVSLVYQNRILSLTVVDNGVGFDYRGDLRLHFGLTNMRERARQLGGTFTVESAPGKGCRLSLELPASESFSVSMSLPD
jgi:two-component system, NarL family, sensor histidine kinase DegS